MGTFWDFPRFASELLKAGSAHIDSDTLASSQLPKPCDDERDPLSDFSDALGALFASETAIVEDIYQRSVERDHLIEDAKRLVEDLQGAVLGLRESVDALRQGLDVRGSHDSSSSVGASAVTDAGSSAS